MSQTKVPAKLFVSARTKAEYVKMFALTGQDLSLRILDCAAGAASFTAESRADGGLVWAVDPLYGLAEPERVQHVESGYARATKNISDECASYNWIFPSSPEEHKQLRRYAADLFLKDIAVNREFYINGNLEKLPFEDSTFDIVICSHFLFTYAYFIDDQTHVRYIREMLRVATKCVRIYPIIGFGADAESALTSVVAECKKLGHKCVVKDVDYCFLKGSGRMLLVEKHAA